MRTRRASRKSLVLLAVWAAISLILAVWIAELLHDFDLCISEWGGCPEEHPPHDRAFVSLLVKSFLYLWVPVAATIALGAIFVVLGSAVADDFRAGRARRELERR